MFTGIVEELGSVAGRDGDRLRINASLVLEDVQLGASIAVNGCCLTVVDWGSDDGDWRATSRRGGRPTSSTSRSRRTASASLHTGDPVNLERPVRLQDRLGGHLVQGHVDGVGEIVEPCARPPGACRAIAT